MARLSGLAGAPARLRGAIGGVRVPGQAHGAFALVRVDPERGSLLAAAAVLLTVGVLLTDARFDDEWAAGGRFVFAGLPAALLVLLAFSAPRREGPASTWFSALLVSAFVLSALALGNLGDALGSQGALESSGTITWVGAVTTALLVSFALRYDSGVSTLLAGAVGTITVLAFVDWAFGLDDPLRTFRWLLVLCSLGLAVGAAVVQRRDERHALALVDAAGLAALGLALTFAVEALISTVLGAFGGDESAAGTGWGWELFLLVAAAGLVAYAIKRRAAGPGYLAAANLLAFVLLAADAGEGGPSIVGWPLALLAVALAALALALRPDGRPPAPATGPDAAPPGQEPGGAAVTEP